MRASCGHYNDPLRRKEHSEKYNPREPPIVLQPGRPCHRNGDNHHRKYETGSPDPHSRDPAQSLACVTRRQSFVERTSRPNGAAIPPTTSHHRLPRLAATTLLDADNKSNKRPMRSKDDRCALGRSAPTAAAGRVANSTQIETTPHLLNTSVRSAE